MQGFKLKTDENTYGASTLTSKNKFRALNLKFRKINARLQTTNFKIRTQSLEEYIQGLKLKT